MTADVPQRIAKTSAFHATLALLTLFAALLSGTLVQAEPLTTPASDVAKPAADSSASLAAASTSPSILAAATPRPLLSWASGAAFLAGAGTAFVAHETCHLAANYGTGNQPSFERVTFLGFIPFVAIVPSITCRNGECYKHNREPYYTGRPGLYTIVSAGLQCQHYEDEVILSTRPELRLGDAPFRKGMLAFNTLLSLGYVLSNLAGVEPADGDLRGMKRDGGAPRALAVSLVFGIAAMDIARYYFPQSRWLIWLSRAAKMGVTGTAFAM